MYYNSEYESGSSGWEPMTADAFARLEVARKKVPHWHPNMQNPIHPAHAKPHPGSIIDVNFKLTRQQKINGIVHLARCTNMLGKLYKLQFKYSYAIPALKENNLNFEVIDAPFVVNPTSKRESKETQLESKI